MNAIVQNSAGPFSVRDGRDGSPPPGFPERSEPSAPGRSIRFPPGDGLRALYESPATSGKPPSTLPDIGNARGGFFGLINSLVDSLGALIDSLAPAARTGATQHVADATLSSTGDPHLNETGTLTGESGNLEPIDRHFDSMIGHNDLIGSQDFAGGYRLSTSVTQPSDTGISRNAAASVHLNGEGETVTMRNDGTYAITDNGNDIRLDPSQSVTLENGALVSRATDGSLTVVDRNTFGGSATTTLAANNGGVDATATIHQATITGDIVDGPVVPPAYPVV